MGIGKKHKKHLIDIISRRSWRIAGATEIEQWAASSLRHLRRRTGRDDIGGFECRFKKHDESWRLVNNITRYKSLRWDIIKEKYQENTVRKWYDRFRNLFGKVWDIGEENVDKDLEDVLHNLQVEDREVRRRKRSWNTEHLT